MRPQHPTPSNEVICFEIAPIRRGIVLAALSEKGVAAILLGWDRVRLIESLAHAFPTAMLVENDPNAAKDIAKIVRFTVEPQMSQDLPMDLRGAEFELAVWQHLSCSMDARGDVAPSPRLP
jgi:AraC family transcriptional regulator of adaptative response/methylated-DNA-[protein]-cysteine methyltransferase